jgi:hypothetical protein
MGAVRTLESDKLLYQIENSDATFAATKLGQTVSFTGLSSETGAMFGAFLRALISFSERNRGTEPNAENLLRRLSRLDLLVLCLASFETRDFLLPTLKDDQLHKLEEYLELLPPDEKPLVNIWRDPASANFPTRRLLSTLRFPRQTDPGMLWRLLRTAVMLHEHATGRHLDELTSNYGGYEGDIEGRLKPTVIWLLSALAQICTGSKCYKLDFLSVRAHVLMRDLIVGGSLGRLLDIQGIGLKSIEKLVAAGIRGFHELANLQPGALVSMGLRREQAAAISRTVNRATR